MSTKNIGDFGEISVCEYLIKKGYTIIERNFHTAYGEIDIIAEKNNCICFVEVKTRKNNRYGNASEYVDKAKQKKIIASALLYLGENTDAQTRFDVAEVYYYKTEAILTVKRINYIENAFIYEE